MRGVKLSYLFPADLSYNTAIQCAGYYFLAVAFEATIVIYFFKFFFLLNPLYSCSSFLLKSSYIR